MIELILALSIYIESYIPQKAMVKTVEYYSLTEFNNNDLKSAIQTDFCRRLSLNTGFSGKSCVDMVEYTSGFV